MSPFVNSNSTKSQQFFLSLGKLYYSRKKLMKLHGNKVLNYAIKPVE